MVEYPTLKFSRIAAGMINTNPIQLQFLLNHASSSARLSTRTKTIDKSPHGNIKNDEGLDDGAMVKFFLWQKDKNYLATIAYFYYRYLHSLFVKSIKLIPFIKHVC
jgi:hypothetical protein